MCGLASQLLAEKLIDDFYEEDGTKGNGSTGSKEDALTEELKSLLPADSHALLFRWEAQCAETCEQELRRFAKFMADIILVGVQCSESSRMESREE